MIRINGKNLRYHFAGVHGKVAQIRELVETLDHLLDSFQRVNTLSRSVFRSRSAPRREWDRLE